MKRIGKALRHLVANILKVVFVSPLLLLAAAFRFLYRFRVQGVENMPKMGPFIVLFPEISVISNISANWAFWMTLRRPLLKTPDKVLSFAQEQLWALPYFRTMMEKVGNLRPLAPHGAGQFSLHLLEGYKILKEKGIVTMNPEGDMPWDGRPLPLGSGAAWLALHTGAQLVPLVWSNDVYDIWPRWEMRPQLGGRVTLTVGAPFSVCDAPLPETSETDIARANARIRAELDRLAYGEKGIIGWTGTPTLKGQHLDKAPEIWLIHEPPPEHEPLADGQVAPIWKRGVAQLLWRCPVCHTDDALVHEHRSRPQTLRCRVCRTVWALRRVRGKDFRLEVLEGPAELIGLDMALLTWYDEMKRNFAPKPISLPDVTLNEGEMAYLTAQEVAFAPAPPNPLYERWDGSQPPRTQILGKHKLGAWRDLDCGRLTLTNQRLLFQGARGELHFEMKYFYAVSIWLANTLGLRYGAAPYRFSLNQENGLKWLAYTGTLAREAAKLDGHKVSMSSF